MTIGSNICKFKWDSNLDHVIVGWTANTEHYSDLIPGANGDTTDILLAAIKSSHAEVSPSTQALFTVAAVKWVFFPSYL